MDTFARVKQKRDWLIFFIFREENLQSKMLTNQDADWPRIRLPEEMCRRVCVGVCLVREKCDVILIIT
jgi:hypothetical protein